MSEFGKNLQAFREKKDLSQKELAEKVGISQKSISAYETGNRRAKYPMLVNISKVLGCTVDELDPLYKYDDVHYQDCPMPGGCPLSGGEEGKNNLEIIKYFNRPENRLEKLELLVKIERLKNNATGAKTNREIHKDLEDIA